MTEPSEPKNKLYIQLARYSEIGFIIPAALVVGWLLGALLDRWLHTGWMTAAGVILGAIAGFVQMIRIALRSAK